MLDRKNDKEKLTDATIKILQGQEEIDDNQKYNNNLKKLFEGYIQDDNLSGLIELLISIIPEEKLLSILSQCNN